MNKQLQNEFRDAMLSIYNKAKEECDYNATRFLQMVSEHGGLDTAKILLKDKNLSDGYIKMWQLGRLDISMEREVLKPKWKELFASEELEIARKRLIDSGYRFEDE